MNVLNESAVQICRMLKTQRAGYYLSSACYLYSTSIGHLNVKAMSRRELHGSGICVWLEDKQVKWSVTYPLSKPEHRLLTLVMRMV